MQKETFFGFSTNRATLLLFRFVCSGERTCRESWRQSHGIRGRCVQEKAGINCRKHVEMDWRFFSSIFFVKNIKMKTASTHFL